jgi:hypothetical protein
MNFFGLVANAESVSGGHLHLSAPTGKTPPIHNLFRMMAGTTGLEPAASAVTGNNEMELIDIKRCRRTSLGSGRYCTTLLVVPLTYPDFINVTRHFTCSRTLSTFA